MVHEFEREPGLAKRAKFGDVVEIATPKGKALLQYTHRHASYGELIRVLPGFHDALPSDLDALARSQEDFVMFFPLQVAINRGIVRIVGRAEIPERARPFPLFRNGVQDPVTKTTPNWWLWDGEKEWRVGALTEEQRKLPVLGVCNDTFLVDRIVEGWRPEHER